MNAQLLLGAKEVYGFSKILYNISKTITHWGNYVLLLVGIVLIAYGGIALFKAIKSLGGQQGSGGGTEWVKAVLAIIIGIILAAAKIGDIRHNSGIDGNTLQHALNGEG